MEGGKNLITFLLHHLNGALALTKRSSLRVKPYTWTIITLADPSGTFTIVIYNRLIHSNNYSPIAIFLAMDFSSNSSCLSSCNSSCISSNSSCALKGVLYCCLEQLRVFSQFTLRHLVSGSAMSVSFIATVAEAAT